jgi:SAM-dependent methyltransferase
MPRISASFAKYFGPQDLPDSPYPLNRLGSFARLDRNYLPHWVDLDQLRLALLGVTSTGPSAVSTDMLVEAIGVIGAVSYSAEWVDDPETAEDLDNSVSAASVLEVNDLIGAEVAGHVERLSPSELHILDIGVGRGNTLLPVLHQLSRAGYEHMRVSLMDISHEQLSKTAERIERAGRATGVRIDLVELIEGNLHEMGISLPVRADSYDVVVSGGTLFHSTDKQRIFDWVHDSLRGGGLFVFWDWFAPCWAAPKLRVGRNSRYDGTDSFVTTLEQAGAAAQTWAIGWFGPRGYFNYGSAKYAPLVASLNEHLTRFKAGEHITFLQWLSRVATSYPEPERLGHYYCIEGYTTPDVYQAHIAEAGYTTLGTCTQAQLRARHGHPPERLAGDGYDNSIQIFALQRRASN